MNDCTYIYKMKPNAENLPMSESLYESAKLVCQGDKDYPNWQKTSQAEDEKLNLPRITLEK